MTTTNPTAANTLQAKTICLSLSRGKFGNSRKASLAHATFDKDELDRLPQPARLKLTKTLLDSPELEAIAIHDSETSANVKNRSFASKFKGGVYLVAVGEVQEIEDYLTVRAAERVELVETAKAMYPTRVEEASADLAVVHDLADYPTPDLFASKFYFEWQWITFETPTRLKEISASIFASETAKAASKLSAVADGCQQAMRAMMVKLVDHLTAQVTPGEDGKKKRFSKATIANFNDFLRTFSLRDVTDDAALGALVTKAQAIMEGVDPAVLKSDTLIQQKIREELEGLSAALAPLVVTVGDRQIDFEDDGDDDAEEGVI